MTALLLVTHTRDGKWRSPAAMEVNPSPHPSDAFAETPRLRARIASAVDTQMAGARAPMRSSAAGLMAGDDPPACRPRALTPPSSTSRWQSCGAPGVSIPASGTECLFGRASSPG